MSETEERRDALVRAGAKRSPSHETSRRNEAARRSDNSELEMNVWHEYI